MSYSVPPNSSPNSSESDATHFDQQIMQRCLMLARRATGQTAPNPLVGSVIVKNGAVIGEGFHPRAGEPHAEVFALRSATESPQGATLYVNLEPCSHYGRTPPCANAIIEAGIARVVVGMVDPNPQVAGRGIERLRAAGVEVKVGVEEAACQELNEGFTYRMRYQKPLGILKYAMTLDGKIATTTGQSAWITSPVARSWVHQLRSTCDAVIVGGNTVRQDNPLLTSHGQGHNPLRVVMSRALDLPLATQLWQTDVAPTLVLTHSSAPIATIQQLEQQGVEVLPLPDLTPAAAMQVLYTRNCLSVLWECGGTLAAQAIADGAVQKVFAFIAPKIIGGSQAPSPIGELEITHMNQALVLEKLSVQTIGPDYLITGYLPFAKETPVESSERVNQDWE